MTGVLVLASRMIESVISTWGRYFPGLSKVVVVALSFPSSTFDSLQYHDVDIETTDRITGFSFFTISATSTLWSYLHTPIRNQLHDVYRVRLGTAVVLRVVSCWSGYGRYTDTQSVSVNQSCVWLFFFSRVVVTMNTNQRFAGSSNTSSSKIRLSWWLEISPNDRKTAADQSCKPALLHLKNCEPPRSPGEIPPRTQHHRAQALWWAPTIMELSRQMSLVSGLSREANTSMW